LLLFGKEKRNYLSMPVRRLSIFLLAPLIALTACRESKVTAYRIPKETETAGLPAGHPPASGTMPGADPGTPGGGASDNMANAAPVPVAEGAALVWTVPATWVARQGSPMLKASYDVTGASGTASVTVSGFPGTVGGELANINRWRGQIGLAPIAENDLDATVDRIESNGLHLAIVELIDSKQPKGTIGAIVPVGGETWFFKITGPTALIGEQKAAFRAFLKTIKATQP
jgi:hypothetical protein